MPSSDEDSTLSKSTEDSELGSSNESSTMLETEPAQLSGMLKAHNAVRSLEGQELPALTWSSELAIIAQSYADDLAQQGCPLTHSGGPFGENLYWSKGLQSQSEGVVDSWASEKVDYDYSTNECSGVCGHYTQIVWRDTKTVGCGMSACASSEEVWVCNYDPPGNWQGEKPY
jgi:uncharacterized protein YkwD